MELGVENQAIGRLTHALRTLEERRSAGLSPPWHVVSFLSALDRRLDPDERRYIAMVFGACREEREELTAALVERLGIERGAVIAALSAHLEGTVAPTTNADVPQSVVDYLEGLRAGVLAKMATIP